MAPRALWIGTAGVLVALAMMLPAVVGRAQPAVPALPLRVIVVADPDEARRVDARLAGGEAFDVVARAASIDGSAATGGYLGMVDPATLRSDVRSALDGLRAGQRTGVVAIPTGFAIFQVQGDAARALPPPEASAARAAIASVGNVKYVADIGGLPEAEALLRDYPKAADWNLDPRTMCQVRQDSLEAGVRIFDRFLAADAAPMRESRPAFQVMQAHLGLAQLLAYQGLMARAVEHFDRALGLARSGAQSSVPLVQEMLGVALLHKAGIDNGAFRRPSDLCLFPPPPGVSYAATADLEQALSHLLALGAQHPDDLEVRWLLNVAAGMLGRYPDGVPAAHRLPADAFGSPEQVGRFRDAAADAGLNVFGSAGGVIVDDLSGSGRFDVVTSNFYTCGPLHYFGNNGDGTFTERTAAAGLRDQVGGLNIVQADYDNDSCPDMLVLRGGWEVPQRNSLLRNTCNGTFTDVTQQAGLAAPATSTQAAAWADIDNDGWLDLFIGNEDRAPQLFHSLKDGRFEDIAAPAGLTRQSFAKGVSAGDFDNDGFIDFYVSSYDGPSRLYRNRGDRTFEDVTTRAGVPGTGRGFATWFFDYDNDGWLDVFATSYFMSVEETARTYLGLPHNATTLMLYRNQRNGTFEDVTRLVGLDKVFMPMGANFGDIDNDGFLDIYLGMGSPSYAAVLPHVLLRNHAGRAFVDVTASSGTGEIHKGHGIAFADLDNDGDQDIVAEIGGATPGDSHATRLFENPGHGHDWVGVKLVGTRSNRSAIGVRITATVGTGDRRRAVHRQVGSGGTFGASPLEQHIGLGADAPSVDLDVWWPSSGTRQHLTAIRTNQVVEIREGSDEVRPLGRRAVRFGGERSAR